MQNAECRAKNEKTSTQLRARTKSYALRIVRLYVSLEKGGIAQVLGRQLVRSGTSVGAHHREACRARSVAEFVSKLEGGLQELEETAYWLELLVESKIVRPQKLALLMDETEQLLAMFVASVKTAKQKRNY